MGHSLTVKSSKGLIIEFFLNCSIILSCSGVLYKARTMFSLYTADFLWELKLLELLSCPVVAVASVQR